MPLADNSDPIINVSAAYLDNRKEFEPLPPGVNSLHEGIKFLQENLKQLEGKYNDLYKHKDRPEGPLRPSFEIKSYSDQEGPSDVRPVNTDLKVLLQTYQ